MVWSRPPRRPMWTDDPVRDEMAWQTYLEECKEYDEEQDYVLADMDEDERRTE